MQTLLNAHAKKRSMILIADDSEINREILKLIFDEDYEVIEACDGEEAMNLIDRFSENIALVLLDMQMPNKTGMDVLIHVNMKNLQDLLPIIVVTSTASQSIHLQSLEYGVADIIVKPFDSRIVKRRAHNVIELYSHKEDIEYQLDLWKKDALKMHEQVAHHNELLINALSSVVEFRSLESGLHIKRVSELTKILCRTWGILYPKEAFSETSITEIAKASTLHDIGKVAIPDNILLKPARLTSEEYEIMKSHTLKGCEMLERIKEDENSFYRYCYEICRHHHERCDGKGYPDGLTGDAIPVCAQIVSIIDVFDALISPRVYKDPFSYEKAIEMIKNGECGAFSEKLLCCFETAKDQIIAESQRLTKMSKYANIEVKK